MPILLEQSYSDTPVEETCLHIPLEKITWRACGDNDPLTRLIARVQIGGADHHLEAREMRQSEVFPNDWEPVEYPEDIDALEGVAGSAFVEFVEIEGRTYCLFMTPYS
jgi:hypothetical protein